MPMYEYFCKDCDKTFEELAKFEDQIECPVCQKISDKLVSATKGKVLGSHNPVKQ